MPTAAQYLDYFKTPDSLKPSYNFFTKPTAFSYISAKGKLVITDNYRHRQARLSLLNGIQRQTELYTFAQQFLKHPGVTLPAICKTIAIYRTGKSKAEIPPEILCAKIACVPRGFPVYDRYKLYIPSAVLRKFGIEDSIFLRVLLYAKLELRLSTTAAPNLKS